MKKANGSYDGTILNRNVPMDAESKKSVFFRDDNDLRPFQPIKLTALQWVAISQAVIDLNKRVVELEEKLKDEE